MIKLRGFSLIEVLITLVISAISILGMLSLQSQGLKGTNESAKRTTAVMASLDLMEIVQSYRHELYDNKDPVYSNIKSSTDIYDSNGAFLPAETDCSSPANTLLARTACWKNDLDSKLNGSSVSICPSYRLTSAGKIQCDSNDGGMLAIQIEWTSTDNGMCTDNRCHFVLRMEI